jgi:hypothetical protein
MWTATEVLEMVKELGGMREQPDTTLAPVECSLSAVTGLPVCVLEMECDEPFKQNANK